MCILSHRYTLMFMGILTTHILIIKLLYMFCGKNNTMNTAKSIVERIFFKKNVNMFI